MAGYSCGEASERTRKKRIEMKRSKRYLISLIAGIILAILAFVSVLNNMEVLASACVAGIMTILTSYIWSETKRPSNNNDNETKPQ
ncbi:MAG: hypothetical protein A2W93_03505 [Bacteroidetes bacterium GWF2_43_63]|nr:MAG: hypothetical protein A2W93_03505 [Bacteroidetes bacterium GWF2_43_63]HBG70494.1 hypothetical protein [Bacteroidales bacterium]HCB61489.1 hypothetical protein [Bacteroidales bacterium]